jgi:hypothetical protein
MKIVEIENGVNITAETDSEYSILERFWRNGVEVTSVSTKNRSLRILDRKERHH